MISNTIMIIQKGYESWEKAALKEAHWEKYKIIKDRTVVKPGEKLITIFDGENRAIINILRSLGERTMLTVVVPSKDAKEAETNLYVPRIEGCLGTLKKNK